MAEGKYIPYYRISNNPHVFVSILDANITENVFLHVKSGHAFLFQWWTTQGRKKQYCDLKKRLDVFKDISFTILACTEYDNAKFESMGYDSIFCSPNAFVDEFIFYPIKTMKKWNAIYNAQIVPYKRLELAKDVQGLGIISFINENQSFNNTYRESVLNMIGREKLINRKLIDPCSVRNILVQSKCGLILSKEEGANYATMEYLLCGIPVVTTENVGGRNEFLDHTNSITVPDNSIDIKNAVNNIANYNFYHIRENTITKMLFHRLIFYNHLKEKFGENILDNFVFKNKLLNWISYSN